VQSTYAGWPWIKEEIQIFIRIEAPPFYQRQSFSIGVLAALIVAIFLIIILRMRNIAMKKELEISRLEKEASIWNLNFLKSQMNPHFYFNTLNSINSYIMQNDVRSANKYLTTFAKLMREILENSQKEFVTVDEEREVLEKYISLQQLRFAGLFDFTIEINDGAGNYKIPPMLLQPFVENSVEYAFSGMPMKGILTIVFGSKNNQLICSVTDTGIGIEKSNQLKIKSNRKSTAIKNIYNRIEILNRIYGVSIQLELLAADENNTEYPGTLVRISLPDFGKIGVSK
jgi:sensor histidine kinase YesM